MAMSACQLVSPQLCSKLKYLYNYWTHCHRICVPNPIKANMFITNSHNRMRSEKLSYRSKGGNGAHFFNNLSLKLFLVLHSFEQQEKWLKCFCEEWKKRDWECKSCLLSYAAWNGLACQIWFREVTKIVRHSPIRSNVEKLWRKGVSYAVRQCKKYLLWSILMPLLFHGSLNVVQGFVTLIRIWFLS